MRHRQVPQRLRRGRLNDKSAVPNPWYQFLEDAKFRRIELIVCKVERVYLCLYCCKARLGIVVSPSVLNELRDWAQRKSRKEA
jgi:hypothetical protein